MFVFALFATDAPAQHRSTGAERREARRAERKAFRHDPARWDRMPFWSAGLTVSTGYPARMPTVPGAVQQDNKSTAAYHLEGSRRLKKGWFVMTALEHNSLRSACLANAEVITSWSDGWFGDGWTQYRADVVTVEQNVNTLALMTGVFNAPFPRRRNVGMTVSAAGGLGVHVVGATAGLERNVRCTVTYGWFEPDHHDVLAQWKGRDVFHRQTAAGLSALLDLRGELWFGKRISLPTTLGFTLPLVRPRFSAAGDPEGLVQVESRSLDLHAVRIGAGLVVHF